jgi:HEAT repeat protein
VSTRVFDLLSSADADERNGALHTLVTMGAEARPAVTALLAACRHDDALTRGIAINTFGWLVLGGVPELIEHVPVLITALHDDEWRVRASALHAFRGLGPAAGRFAPNLVEAASRGGSSGRSAALEALARVAPTEPQGLALAASLLGVFDAHLAGCAGRLFVAGADPELRRSTVARYAALLDSPKPEERQEGARAARQLQDEALVPPLIAHIADEDERVRATVLYTLGRIGPVAVPAIPRLMGVIERGAEEATDALPTGASTSVTLARQALGAIAGLGEIAVTAAPLAARLLTSPSIDLRTAAAVALHGIGRAAAPFAPDLRAALAADAGELRARLWRRWCGLDKLLVHALVVVDPDKRGLVELLIPLLDEDPALATATESRELRDEVVRALGDLSPDAVIALPLLRALTADPHLSRTASIAVARLEHRPPA